MTRRSSLARSAWVVAAAALLAGCQLLDQTPPEEKVAKACFNAIKTNNWKAFTEHVATQSDFIFKPDKNANPLTGGHTMGSAMIRSEEMDFLHGDFDRAVQSGESLVDFKRAEYVSLGAERKTGQFPMMSGDLVDYTIYSFRVKINGAEQDTAGTWPKFMLVKYDGKPKLFAIMFSDMLPQLFGETMLGDPGMGMPPPVDPGRFEREYPEEYGEDSP